GPHARYPALVRLRCHHRCTAYDRAALRRSRELYMIRRVLAVYYRQFSNADFATVLLVTIIVVFVLTLIYGVLLGGRPMHWAMGFSAFVSITELHHLVERIAQRRYVPGLVTGVLWAAIGVQLARVILQHSQADASA